VQLQHAQADDSKHRVSRSIHRQVQSVKIGYRFMYRFKQEKNHKRKSSREDGRCQRRSDLAEGLHAAEEADDAEGAHEADDADGHVDGAERDEGEDYNDEVADGPAVVPEGVEPVALKYQIRMDKKILIKGSKPGPPSRQEKDGCPKQGPHASWTSQAPRRDFTGYCYNFGGHWYFCRWRAAFKLLPFGTG
jgi:hypothetical protein